MLDALSQSDHPSYLPGTMGITWLRLLIELLSECTIAADASSKKEIHSTAAFKHYSSTARFELLYSIDIHCSPGPAFVLSGLQPEL